MSSINQNRSKTVRNSAREMEQILKVLWRMGEDGTGLAMMGHELARREAVR